VGFPSAGSWVTYGLGTESTSPAGVRRHRRRQGRPDRRSDQLERGIYAGCVSGNTLPRERRSHRRLEAGCWNDTRDPALAAGSAWETE
jgi:hypothetical protein